MLDSCVSLLFISYHTVIFVRQCNKINCYTVICNSEQGSVARKCFDRASAAKLIQKLLYFNCSTLSVIIKLLYNNCYTQ